MNLAITLLIPPKNYLLKNLHSKMVDRKQLLTNHPGGSTN